MANSKITRWVEWAQLLALLVALAAWICPDFFSKRELSPLILRALFSTLVVVLLAYLLLTRRKRVRKSRKFRVNHNLEQRKRARFMGVGLGADDKGLAIDRHFVEPRLQMAHKMEMDRSVGEDWTPTRVLRHAVENHQDGIVIWGMAGSGKSALAQWLAHQIALPETPSAWLFLQRSVVSDTEAERQRGKRVLRAWDNLMMWLGLALEDHDRCYPYPFLVQLQHELHEKGEPGTDFIISLLQQSCSQTDVMDLISRGLVLPIFDGFDELSGPSKQVFLQSLRSFMMRYPGNRPFVLTVREPIPTPMNVSMWRLLPFNERQIRQYIKQYYENEGQRMGGDGPEQLWKAIRATAQATPKVWQLLTEPLLLALITYIFDPTSSTPLATDRVTIYEAYLKRLSERRYGEGHPEVHRLPQGELDPGGILGSVAFRLLDKQQHMLSRNQISPEEKTRLDEFVGVLTWRDARDNHGFFHPAFRTYFAASHLGRLICQEKREAGENRWRATVARGIPLPADDQSGSQDTRQTAGQEQELWPAYWREALAFATGLLVPRPAMPAGSSDIQLESTFVYQNTLS